MPETEPTSDANRSESTETPDERYKSLQRELNKAREQYKKAVQEKLDTEQLKTQIGVLTTAIKELGEAIRVGEAEEQVADILARADRAVAATATTTEWKRRIVDEIASVGISLDDEGAAPVRERLDKGDLMGAFLEATKIARTTPANNIEAEIESRVRAALAKLGVRVDVNTPNAPASSGLTIEDIKRMTPRERLERINEIKAFAAKRLR